MEDILVMAARIFEQRNTEEDDRKRPKVISEQETKQAIDTATAQSVYSAAGLVQHSCKPN